MNGTPGPGGLRIIRPGPFATLRDGGRFGLRDRGVPPGGAFDLGSLRLATTLAGDPPRGGSGMGTGTGIEAPIPPALETTFGASAFEAESRLILGIAGGPAPGRVESATGRPKRRLPGGPVRIALEAGDRLILDPMPRGARVYLATPGGWAVDSTRAALSDETPIPAGTLLRPAAASNADAESGRGRGRLPDFAWLAPPDDSAFDFEAEPIPLMPGPDARSGGSRPGRESWGKGEGEGGWIPPACVVDARSNRRGLRLIPAGPLPECWRAREDRARGSTPVAPGALQWTGSEFLLLGPACGTLGGYPHVGQAPRRALDRLGQARPGDRIAFRAIDAEEGRRLDREAREAERRRLTRIALGLEASELRPGGGGL